MKLSRKIFTILLLSLICFNSQAIGDQDGSFFSAENEIKVYPIPVTDGAVNLESDLEITKIEVLNILGQTIYEQQFIGDNKIKLELETNESGLYIFQIKTRDGRVTTKRVLFK